MGAVQTRAAVMSTTIHSHVVTKSRILHGGYRQITWTILHGRARQQLIARNLWDSNRHTTFNFRQAPGTAVHVDTVTLSPSELNPVQDSDEH